MIRARRTEAPAPDLAFEKGAFRLGPGAALLRGARPNCEEVFKNTPQQAGASAAPPATQRDRSNLPN
ncbi:hypothetical protein JL2886_02531 [Phaeobacter gallaeciensis]|uniref:Uncharacterized protein n=1 Tax=Phaeobacter gallaeciensis TaxID=60890 RepID=A0A1B0ZTI4_9RHOB|nr:hypothetical protein JL2886_02531 [Phaeobacter gallaeciensis]